MDRLNIIYILGKLKQENLRIFTVLEFQRVFNLSYETAKKIIYRYVKRGIFIKAKKGIYFLKENPPSDFLIANKIYQPSYISFETALSFYGIIPETIYEITSATTLPTREFVIKDLKFSYKKIKQGGYFGYLPKKIGEEIIFIAEQEKALLDFFYFVSLAKREMSYERIDFSRIKRKKLIEYAKNFKNEKLLNFVKNL